MRAWRLTLGVVLATAGLGLVPVAVAAPSPVAPTVESWYQANPACTTPVGCLVPADLALPVTAFPAGTLHVAVLSGQETARTYFGLDRSSLAGATGAVLTVPLDVSPLGGTLMPEVAKLQVCLATGPLVQVEMSLAEPPTVDCTSTALVSYVALPAPHLEADLDPLLPIASGATGLALLPDATNLAPSDAWRTVFSSRSRTGEGISAPASLLVERGTTPPATVPSSAPTTVVDLPGSAVAAPQVPLDLPTASEPLLPVDAPAVAAPPSAPVVATTVPVQQAAFPQTVRVGYAYPVVWLLPLVLLVLVPAIARTLTRDLTPPEPVAS